MSPPAQEASCALESGDEAALDVSKSTNHTVAGLRPDSCLSLPTWLWTLFGDPNRPPSKAPEDPLTHETKMEVKAILIRDYYHNKIDDYRHKLKHSWTTDEIFPILDSCAPIPPFKTWQLSLLYHNASNGQE